MAIPLSDLDAKLVHTTTDGSQDVDALADADGVMFDCPKCRDHKIGVLFTAAPQGVAWDPSRGKRWTAEGTSLQDLTLSPSILLLSGCQWHGFVRNGEAVDA